MAQRKAIKRTKKQKPVVTNGNGKRHSAHLSDPLLRVYSDSLNAGEQEQLKVDTDLALVDALISDALKQMQTGELLATAERKELVSINNLMRRGKARHDHTMTEEALKRLDALATESMTRREWLNDVKDLMNLRDKLVNTALRYMKSSNDLVPIEKMNLVMALAMVVINRELMDHGEIRKVMSILSEEWYRVTGNPALLTVPGGVKGYIDAPQLENDEDND
jgi:hypothetical protein